jgi:hypothetical protein
MTQNRRRQLARFERRALSYIRANRNGLENGKFESIRRIEFGRVACVCLLTLYGAPRIDESLATAWRRVCQSAAWRARRKEHPHLPSFEGDDHFRMCETPFDLVGAMLLGGYFREFFLADLPGSNESEKLNAVLAAAPPWLIWFSNTEISIKMCGLKAPDISKERRFLRAPPSDGLPVGQFERKLRPAGVDDWHDVELRKFAATRVPVLPAHLTPRERKRALRLIDDAEHRQRTSFS